MRVPRPVFVLPPLLIACLLGGCGSTASPPAYRTYTDSRYGFSFQYPSDFKAPRSQQGTADGVPSYIVALKSTDIGLRIAVNDSLPNFSTITNGQVSRQGNQILTFYRLTISGRPALLIYEKTNGLPLNRESAHLNSQHYGYDIQLAAAYAITKPIQSEFDRVLHTFTLGKNG